MKLSIKECLHQYAAGLTKTWAHDRLSTVGASEVGSCIRKTWFSKNETPHDPGYNDSFGARLRGDLIESQYWEPGIRAQLDKPAFRDSVPDGVRLLYAGADQQTIADGYLSATTDGLLVGVSRDCLAWMGVPDIKADCINLDCKSIDPRIDLRTEKPEHSFQVQAQMGLIRHATQYKPEYSIVSYVEMSFIDEVKEFAVAFDERIYEAAQFRAARVMTTTDPLRLQPEGKMAGGAECKWCPWASNCANVTVAGIPHEDGPKLGDNAAAELMRLRDAERDLAAQEDATAAEHAEAREAIKEFLRTHGIRRYSGDGWSVAWSAVKGKSTIDFEAIEAAGIDLSEYEKTGNPSERLTIK